MRNAKERRRTQRDSLALAGITRQELFESTELTGKLRTRDMRATFVTLASRTSHNGGAFRFLSDVSPAVHDALATKIDAQ